MIHKLKVENGKLKMRRGQTLIEVIVVLGGAAVVVATVTALAISTLVNVQLNKNKDIAAQYTQEGMEFVRRLRDTDSSSFLALPQGEYCLDQGTIDQGISALKPKINPAAPGCASIQGGLANNVDIYARLVTIERGATSCVPPPPGGATPAPASDLTKVTVKLSWTEPKCGSGNLFCKEIETTSCFTSTPNFYTFNRPSPTFVQLSPIPTPGGGIPIYRFWSSSYTDHFYSKSNGAFPNYALEWSGEPVFYAYPNLYPGGTTTFPNSDLTSYWNLDETSAKAGTSISDVVGNNNGSSVGNSSVVTGISRYARQNTSNNYVRIPDASSLEISNNDFTISLWVKFFSLSGRRAFISKWGGNGAKSYYIEYSSSGISFHCSTDGTNDNAYSRAWTTASTNVWYNIALVRSGNNVQYYVNGAPLSGNTNTNANCFDSASPLLLNTADAGGGIFYSLNGIIDEVGLWKRALSQTEVSNIWDNGNTNGIGYIKPCASGKAPVYRSYLSGIDHLYSLSSTEGPNASYTDEGVEFCANTSPAAGESAVYRLYGGSQSDHAYTAFSSEKDWWVSSGYTVEDSAYFYAQPGPSPTPAVLVNLEELAGVSASESSVEPNGWRGCNCGDDGDPMVASYAIDGNTSCPYAAVTRARPGDIEWWKIDLGAQRDIKEIVYNNVGCNGDTFYIQVSNNDFASDITIGSGYGGSDGRWPFNLGARYRYVRLIMRNPDERLNIREIDILGYQ